jgi:hypothetical protein
MGVKKIVLMQENEQNRPSDKLQAFMVLNNIQSVAELVALDDEVLVEMPGFGWHLLKEILLLRKI